MKKNPVVGDWVPKIIHDGKCDHYYEFENDEPNGLKAYKCKHCPNGVLLGVEDTVIEGKICKICKKQSKK